MWCRVISKVKGQHASVTGYCPCSLSPGCFLHGKLEYAEEVEAREPPERWLVTCKISCLPVSENGTLEQSERVSCSLWANKETVALTLGNVYSPTAAPLPFCLCCLFSSPNIVISWSPFYSFRLHLYLVILFEARYLPEAGAH